MCAALTVLALTRYETNTSECIDMINFLKDSEKLNPYDLQFLRDRILKKPYVIKSYFKGTSNTNDYTPDTPYEITMFDNQYIYQNEGYAKLYLKSSGADNPRHLVLRQKGDKWYLWENLLLADIRIPASKDKWV